MKIKTSELEGIALDWAVLECVNGEGAAWYVDDQGRLMEEHGEVSAVFEPSTRWAQGGPIIERNLIQVNPSISSSSWGACNPSKGQCVWVWADTPLIAAMRCYVASKLGDETEVPDELTK